MDNSLRVDREDGSTGRTAAATAGTFQDQLTVEAWVNSEQPELETLQTVVGKWGLAEDFARFAAYDAGRTDGLDATGYCGAAFDGRYVYFAPQHNLSGRHGDILRYDTLGDFKAASSWAARDANGTDGLKTRGFVGAVFDGRYVHFIPRFNGEDYASCFLRYDTRGDFKDAKMWSAFDPGFQAAFQGAGFDGRYLYCVPGTTNARQRSDLFARYDTRAPYRDPNSWTAFDAAGVCGFADKGGGIGFDGAVFDGRYMYFVPLKGAALRYDTTGNFADAASWQAFRPQAFPFKPCIGGVFDGRYVYYVPYANNSDIVRYDTSGAFDDPKAWTRRDINGCSGYRLAGFDGGVFDGRYVYFIPFYDERKTNVPTEAFHGTALRYDTLGEFQSDTAWKAVDAGKTDGLDTRGYSAAAFDGRFAYFVPWHAGEADPAKGPALKGHGRVLRYDTTGDKASFLLTASSYGHNGGLGATVSGPEFIVNTTNGPISARADRKLSPGKRHLVGTYDGRTVRLYVDGAAVAERQSPTAGRVVNNDTDIGFGALPEGGGAFRGTIDRARVFAEAKSPEWVKKQFENHPPKNDKENTMSATFDAASPATGDFGKNLRLDQNLTVETWFEIDRYRAEKFQPLISRWAPSETFGERQGYDAGHTDGLDSKGYLGAVFDGRYVYFSPQANATIRENKSCRHGVVLRYDTHLKYQDAKAWNAYDAGHTDGLETKGYYGAAFDGRYVYFIPRFDGSVYHTRFLRYDTAKSFKDPAAWNAHDIGVPVSYQSAGFDGRYLYFAAGYANGTGQDGRIIRYDTRGDFKSADSYRVYDATNTDGLKTINFDGAVFDGRYLHFVPLANGCPLRYDTRGDFMAPASWQAFDANYLDIKWRVGAVFDGRYIYYAPYSNGKVVRLDTQGAFKDKNAWTVYDAADTDGLACIGYDGAMFDGRFVYFVPFWAGSEKKGDRAKSDFHGQILRYDTARDFHDRAAWRALDVGKTDGLETRGYNAGAFDGRSLYLAAWNQGDSKDTNVVGHGKMLRLDTTGENATFSLRLSDCGHNGGLNAAVTGPVFLINTRDGARSVRTCREISPGKHYLAGTYDGENLALYLDGEKVAERKASGALQASDAPIVFGKIQGGKAAFDGKLLAGAVSDRTLPAKEIKQRYEALKTSDRFAK